MIVLKLVITLQYKFFKITKLRSKTHVRHAHATSHEDDASGLIKCDPKFHHKITYNCGAASRLPLGAIY